MSNKRRGYISWKTRCASALLTLGRVPYNDAKLMTEDQFISLFHWDHNKLYSNQDADRDEWWNLSPMLIKAHREKTKKDAKVIAKSRRIRTKQHGGMDAINELFPGLAAVEPRWPRRKIRSRGFDKTLRRKMDGTVEPR